MARRPCCSTRIDELMASTITVAATITSMIVNPRGRAGRFMSCGLRRGQTAPSKFFWGNISVMLQSFNRPSRDDPSARRKLDKWKCQGWSGFYVMLKAWSVAFPYELYRFRKLLFLRG